MKFDVIHIDNNSCVHNTFNFRSMQIIYAIVFFAYMHMRSSKSVSNHYSISMLSGNIDQIPLIHPVAIIRLIRGEISNMGERCESLIGGYGFKRQL